MTFKLKFQIQMEFEIKMQMEFQCKHSYARILSGFGGNHWKIAEIFF